MMNTDLLFISFSYLYLIFVIVLHHTYSPQSYAFHTFLLWLTFVYIGLTRNIFLIIDDVVKDLLQSFLVLGLIRTFVSIYTVGHVH